MSIRDSLNKLIQKIKEEDESVIFEGDSQYHHITIREEGGRRTLYFGEAGDEAESAINIARPNKAVFEYPGMMLASLPVNPAAKRVLMLGLGGGFLPGLFARHLPQYQLTVVELDIMVLELAQTYFGFVPGPTVEVKIADGRDFIEEAAPASFDQIWLDAFSGDYVPPRLSGLAFLNLCKSRLTDGGLLVQNLHQSRPTHFQRQLKTTQAAFGDFIALEGRFCGNAIITAQTPAFTQKWSPATLTKAAKKFSVPRIGPYDLADEMKKFKAFTPDPAAEVLP